MGTTPHGVSVSNINTVYVASYQNGSIHIWHEGNNTATTILANAYSSYAVVPSKAGHLYLGNPAQSGIDVWYENGTSAGPFLSTGGPCYSIFIDTNDSLYCALATINKVIKRSLNSSDSQTTTVAGNGTAGSLSSSLNTPQGVFVSISFDLYVADTINNRIQLFRPGELNGTTVAGTGANGTIALSAPRTMALDADGNLFILDYGNWRVVASGPGGVFRCVIGCSNTTGSAAHQLAGPHSMAFDAYGNIYVADTNNNRVQQFLVSSNSCGK